MNKLEGELAQFQGMNGGKRNITMYTHNGLASSMSSTIIEAAPYTQKLSFMISLCFPPPHYLIMKTLYIYIGPSLAQTHY
jgi:hypothetical protein